MPRIWLHGMASCLLIATAKANGVRTGGDATVAEPSHRRLQVPDDVEIKDLRCYLDSSTDPLFVGELTGQSNMTPEVCADYCYAKGEYKYYALQNGDECWCASAGIDLTRLIALGMDYCAVRCTGDSASLCGGFGLHVFEFETISPAPVVPASAPPVPLPAPVAPIPSPAPVFVARDVLVDLVPCLFDDTPITEERAALYVMSVFFKGFWSAKTETHIVSQADDLTALLVDTSDSTPHGRCNAVYVGFEPSTVQAAALTAYSAEYKVRIVYFPFANTHENMEFRAKLGIETYYQPPLQFPAFVQLNGAGAKKVSITQPDLQTNPNKFEPPLFSYPVILLNGLVVPGREVLAVFADESSTPILSGLAGNQQNAAMLSYTGADGHEEMHVFFSMASFDVAGWPWAHYLHEWASKGIFMGERRFYLGAVVDDLFLFTPVFEYDGGENEGEQVRCTGDDLSNLLDVQEALNDQYPGSDIITEFAFNGGGIAEKVEKETGDPVNINYVPNFEETEVTMKGTQWQEKGQGLVHEEDWLSINLPRMEEDFDDGTWEYNDDLLVEVLRYLDEPNTFYHQHHSLNHVARDQLRESDCFTEDTGNVQIALFTGMWDSDNYNWRSMVTPRITGLFNRFCLESAAENFVKCYAGDNTFDGRVSNEIAPGDNAFDHTESGAAVLVNLDNQFHSIYTTQARNGFSGAQIVPRYATFVYFNCVTGDCLMRENEYIRRVVCDCEPLDPTVSLRSCSSTAAECIDGDGNTDIRSFDNAEAIFDAEAETTTRNMLTGRRDKYMFHQANIIPAGDVGGDSGMSLLDYWYERVMQEFSKWVTFPVKSIKFDDLCTDFQLHEALDASTPYATMALDATGAVTGFRYVSGSGASLVPLTVPTASAASISTSGLSIQDTERYGTDTTYYLKDSNARTVDRVGSKPDKRDLAKVPPPPPESSDSDDFTTDVTDDFTDGCRETGGNKWWKWWNSRNDCTTDSEDDPNEVSKDDSKEVSKDGSKDDSKDVSKDESKEDSKDISKEDSEDDSNDDSNPSPTPRWWDWNNPRDDPTNDSKQDSKDDANPSPTPRWWDQNESNDSKDDSNPSPTPRWWDRNDSEDDSEDDSNPSPTPRWWDRNDSEDDSNPSPTPSWRDRSDSKDEPTNDPKDVSKDESIDESKDDSKDDSKEDTSDSTDD
eukprot:g13189.t1